VSSKTCGRQNKVTEVLNQQAERAIVAQSAAGSKAAMLSEGNRASATVAPVAAPGVSVIDVRQQPTRSRSTNSHAAPGALALTIAGDSSCRMTGFSDSSISA
jgi:hypothetical protein